MWRRSYGFLGILTALCNFCFLAICDDAEEKAEKVRILIVSGGASHDFSRQLEILKLGLQERVGKEIEWSVRLEDSGRGDIESGIFAENWASEVDLVIHFHCFPRVGDPEFIDRVLEPHQSGLPAVILHGALHSFRTSDDRWFDFCGVQLGSHAKSSEVEVQVMGINHPVAEIIDPWTSPHEELYFVDEVGTGTTILAEGRRFSEGATHESEPVIWVHEYGPANARVFASSLGNDAAGLSIPEFLDMTARGLLWALGKGASDWFVDIAPEDSLKGLPEKRKTHHFLNHGFSILQEGTSNAMSEDKADGHLAEFALDGRSDSYWRASSPGPSVWEVSLAAPAQVSGLAIEWLDSLPQEYLVEGSTDARSWSVLGKGGGDLGEAPRSLHYFPTQLLRSVRVTFPTTRPREHPGIREISGYRSRKDIPAAWALEAGLNDRLGVAAPPFTSKSLRLHPDWELDSRVTAIPPGLRPVELEECADGSLFLLAENAASERSVL
ncbi:MAG: ThuA domain-containing protein, partial [Verrucomicrobiota bacterium]